MSEVNMKFDTLGFQPSIQEVNVLLQSVFQEVGALYEY